MAPNASPAMPLNPLCATCTSVFSCTPQLLLKSAQNPRYIEPGEYFLHESTTHSFKAGAASGCRFCRLCFFLAGYDWYLDRNETLDEETKFRRRFSVVVEGEETFKLKTEVVGGPGGPEYVMRVLLPVQIIPDVESHELELESWTGSPSSMGIAMKWMQKCQADHTRCRAYKQQVQSGRGPTRLLSLGSTKLPHLRICEEVDSVPYATLSHCWGAKMPLRLLMSNKLSMMAAVFPDSLPPTFSDAVTVCRSLGLEYLWIDSLCIIQDSTEDWLKESSQMHNVYSNASLNICGTAAAGSQDGLFVKRDPERLHTGPIPINWDGLCQGVYFGMMQDMWRKGVYHSPLNSRGWVLQERLLSQRNLHFGGNQLFWECQEQVACELTPGGFVGGMEPNYLYRKTLRGKGELLNRSIANDRVEGDEGDEDTSLRAYATWGMIVSTYCQAELTFEKDKLVAISALARHCQTHLGLEGEYLAGLWSNHLASQLLWASRWDSQKLQGYQAPSWSWASLNGPVSDPCEVEHADERDVLVKITGWKMHYVSEDVYGPVSGGSITIAGRLAKVVVCTDTEDPGFPEYDLKVDLDCLIPVKGYFEKDTMFEDSSNKLVIGLYRNLLVMPIRKDVDLPGVLTTRYEWEGLVLRPVEGREGTFERLGKYTIEIGDDGIFEQAFAEFDLHAEQSGLNFESNGDEGNLYTVKII